MTPAEVHAATLREVSLVVEGAAWRQVQASRASVREAWFVAALSRQDKLVDLATLIPEDPSGTDRPATPEALWGRIVSWAANQPGTKIEQHAAAPVS